MEFFKTIKQNKKEEEEEDETKTVIGYFPVSQRLSFKAECKAFHMNLICYFPGSQTDSLSLL